MSWTDYNRLPPFKGPNMFPPDKMERIIKKVRRSWRYCDYFLTPKMKPWCEYIKKRDALQKAKILAQNETTSSGCNFTHQFAMNQVAEGNYSAMTESEPSSNCYDSFFCSTENNERFIYSITVILLIIVIVGLLGHIVYLPSIFKISTKKTKLFFYMVAIGIADFLYLLLGVMIFGSAGIGASLQTQLDGYKLIAVNLVPKGLPIMELSFQLMVWFHVKLLMDHYWYHTSSNQNTVTSRLRFLTNTAVMVVLLSVYTAPKFVEFTWSNENNSTKVIDSYGKIPQFSQLVALMKMAFEMAIPCALLITFISLIRSNKNYLLAKPTSNGHDFSLDEKEMFQQEQTKERESFATSFTLIITIVLSIVLILKTMIHVTFQIMKVNKELVFSIRYIDFAVFIVFFSLRVLLFFLRRKMDFCNGSHLQIPFQTKYKKCDTNATIITEREKSFV